MDFSSLRLPLIPTEAVTMKLASMVLHENDLCFVECNFVAVAELLRTPSSYCRLYVSSL